MAKEIFKRTEKKFMITEQQHDLLVAELAVQMQPDRYSTDGGSYGICNIYYDTHDHYYIRQSLAKPDYKEKLRLRSYGTPKTGDVVYLELKKKVRGVVYKRRSGIVLEDVDRFFAGKALLYPEAANGQVLEEIRAFLRTRPVVPKVYLAYERQAWFGQTDRELRLTFDRQIRTRRQDVALGAGDFGDPLLQNDLWLMELKSDRGLPLWLTGLLSELAIRPNGFSKYGAEYQRYLYTIAKSEGRNVCLKPSLKAQLMPLSPLGARPLAS